MKDCGYNFIMMVKGCADLVRSLVTEVKRTFEDRRQCNIRQFKVYGTTIPAKLFLEDEKDRYFHIFYDDARGCRAREELDPNIEKLEKFLKPKEFQTTTVFCGQIDRHFNLFYDSKDGVLLGAREKTDIIEAERSLCGYYVIVSLDILHSRSIVLITMP